MIGSEEWEEIASLQATLSDRIDRAVALELESLSEINDIDVAASKLHTLQEGLLARAYRSTEQINSLALTLASKLGQRQNASRLVNRLPAEILTDILITSRATCGISMKYFTAHLVCHYWHMLVMTTPRIWSWFHILVDMMSDVSTLPRVEKLLRLSADAALHLEVELRLPYGASIPPMTLRIVTRAIERAGSLHLGTNSFSLFPLPSPLPRLKELRLTTDPRVEPYTITHALPSVSSFEVVENYQWGPSRVTLMPQVFVVERLKVLRFSDSVHPNAAYALVAAASKNLHTLVWQYHHLLKEGDDPVHPSTPLVLVSLVQLILGGDHFHLLDGLTAPCLTSFTHNGADHEILRNGIFGTAARFPLLSTFNLTGNRSGFRANMGYQIPQVLATHPCLSWIILSDMTHEDWEDLLPLREHSATPPLRITCLYDPQLNPTGQRRRDGIIRTILSGGGSLKFEFVGRDLGIHDIIREFPERVEWIEAGYLTHCADRLMEKSWVITRPHVLGWSAG